VIHRDLEPANVLLEDDPGAALLLSVAGAGRAPGVLADGALRAALAACREVRTLPHDHEVADVAFAPDGARLATVTAPAVHLWDVPGGRHLRALEPASSAEAWDGLERVRFGPDGRRVVALARTSGATVWDAATGERLAFLPSPVRGALQTRTLGEPALAFDPGGRRLVTAFGALPDRTAQVWDARTGERLAVLSGHELPVVWAGFVLGGERVATASLDGTAALWDPSTGERLAVLDPADGDLAGAVASPDGRRLVTLPAGRTSTVRASAGLPSITRRSLHDHAAAHLWDAATGALLARLAWPDGAASAAAGAAFAGGGDAVVLGASRGGRLRPPTLWDLASGRPSCPSASGSRAGGGGSRMSCTSASWSASSSASGSTRIGPRWVSRDASSQSGQRLTTTTVFLRRPPRGASSSTPRAPLRPSR